MKKILLLLIATTVVSITNGQVLKRLGDRAKNKVEQKAGDKVDKTIDDATSGKSKKGKTSEEKEGEVKNGDKETQDGGSQNPTLKYNSKYDFVQGEKVVAFEDFSNTEIGDFPERWNTNSSAEVVTLEGKEGKWMKFNKVAVFHPEFIKELPENFTLEFDVAVNNEWGGSGFVFNIANLKDANDYTNYYHYVTWRGVHAVHLEIKPALSNGSTGHSRILAAKDGNYSVNNSVEFNTWNNSNNNFAHVALWRQKTRLRLYVNGEKIWDIPRAFDAESKYNAVTFAADDSYKEADFYLLGNIRLAIGAPDTRNKLITEGKFSTTGIRFNVNSDKLTPDSYGVLKELATALKENADVKIKIIGHTDSDGEDKANMDLSKRRAQAVKTALSSEFGIDEGRMQTDGLGESQPVGENKTPEGKAQNRRVEFIKL